MATPPPPPWSEYRGIAETIGQGVVDAIAIAVGTQVDLGIVASCDPDDLLAGRPLPVRAIVVRFGRPLRDVLVFVSSLKEDVIRPLAALDIPDGSDIHGAIGNFTVESAVEYTDREHALEQCDALYLEASYSMELPTGELRMLLGTGLLESAASFHNGAIDPFAEEPILESLLQAQSLELGATIDADDVPVTELGTDAAPAPAASDETVEAMPIAALDAFDAELAAQEQADAAAARQAQAAKAHATVSAPELLAQEQAHAAHTATSQRWTQLLSGVEVELSAELGRADLNLGDFTSLTTDSVLTLDQMVQEPVTVYVNGTPYATARLVVVDGEYGIEILEVLDQHADVVATLAA